MRRPGIGSVNRDGNGYWLPVCLLVSGLVGLATYRSTLAPAHAVHVPLTAPAAAATLTAAALLAYTAGVTRGRLALSRRLQEADELHRVWNQVTSAETVRGAVECVLVALRKQYPRAAAALLSPDTGPTRTAWRVRCNGGTGAPDEVVVSRLPSNGPLGPMSTKAAQRHSIETVLPGCRSGAAVPIALPGYTETSMLMIGFDDERGLSGDDMYWLDAFARGMALPLERVRVQEELSRLAYTDPMTELGNQRAFCRHLEEECNRAARYGRPLSLLMLDIDRFKTVNDRYGHPAGDTVLRHVSAVARECLRSIDIPTRYGGEEFAILCPDTDGAAVAVLAERLRAALAQSFCALPDGQLVVVTASIGIAVYLEDAISEADLVAHADAGLYHAKRSGRNRVRRLVPHDGYTQLRTDRSYRCAGTQPAGA